MTIVTASPVTAADRVSKAAIYSDRAAKPFIVAPDFNAVPAALRDEPRWVLWRLLWREGGNGKPGKWTKPPVRANGNGADTTDPKTWTTFDRVQHAYPVPDIDAAGIGFALGGGFVGIDLDNVRDPITGEMTPDAAALVERVGTYCEVSPSGTGVKMIGRGTWPGVKHRYPMPGGGEMEVYDAGRYFTVTGRAVGTLPVADVAAVLAALAVELDGPKPDPKPVAVTGEGADSEDTAADNELIARATAAANGPKFLDLWEGGYGGGASPSEADLSLCSLLAFWAGPDPARIDRLFRRSGLFRDKWDDARGEQTYGALTVAKALAARTEFYAAVNDAVAAEPAATGTGTGTGTAATTTTTTKPRPPSAVNALMTIGGRCDLWHDDARAAYATVGRVTYPLKSPRFRRYLILRYLRLVHTPPNPDAVSTALSALEAIAQEEGPRHTAHVRVAGHGGVIYLHLADDASTVIEIDAAGWRVCGDPPVRFVRSDGMMPLPMPVTGGDIKELKAVIGAADDASFTLMVAWLTAALRPTGPYPVLVLSGEQGSAKSTKTKALRALVDPNASPLRDAPKDARDLMIAARHNWVLTLDNMRYLPTWLPDSLCRLATGAGTATRGLYTDDEERVFTAARPVIVNGITDFVDRPDLLERSLLVRLQAIPETERKTESDYWKGFDAAHPRLLGALLDRVSAGLRELPGVTLERLPRMADFALWSAACERGAGESSVFAEAYAAVATDAAEQSIESEPVAAALRGLMASQMTLTTTAAGLLADLEKHVRDNDPARDTYIPRDYARKPDALTCREWPRNARRLAGKLRELAPAMRSVMKLDVAFVKTNGTRRVTVTRTE